MRVLAQDQAVRNDLLRWSLVGDEISLHLFSDAAPDEMIELSIVVDYEYSHCSTKGCIMMIYFLADRTSL
jgi:hypothetical protein